MSWKWVAPNGVGYLVTDRWSLGKPNDVANMMAEVKHLDGLHPKDIFGEDIPLGEIHFTVVMPDTCGCAHRFLARKDGLEMAHALMQSVGNDHAKLTQEQLELLARHQKLSDPVAHRGLRHCNAHQQHREDHAAHFQAIMAENQHKNITVSRHAEAHNVPQHEISFKYDEHRDLVIAHPVFGEKRVPLPKTD